MLALNRPHRMAFSTDTFTASLFPIAQICRYFDLCRESVVRALLSERHRDEDRFAREFGPLWQQQFDEFRAQQ